MNPEYQLNEQLILNDMFTMNRFYVDIEFLKYIRLGKILAHNDLTQEQFDMINQIVSSEDFQKRDTNDPEILFKDVPNIIHILNSNVTHNDDLIMIISPTFKEALDLINGCLIKTQNVQRLTNNTTQPKMIVDVSSLPNISYDICERICMEYEAILEINVSVSKEPQLVIAAKALMFDSYFVSDISKFNEAMIDPLNAQQLVDKNLFCSKLLPRNRLPNVNENNIDLTFNNIELLMTAASKFQYVSPFTCLT